MTNDEPPATPVEPIVSLPLKPCPFCGSLDVSIRHIGNLPVFVQCQRCAAEGPMEVDQVGTEDEIRLMVKIAWNTRNGDRCAAGCWIKAAVKEMNDSVPSNFPEAG